jgi:hypothetical protein
MIKALFEDLGTLDSAETWFVAWIGSVNGNVTGETAKIDVLLYPLREKIVGPFKGNKSQLQLSKSKIPSIDVGLLTAIQPGQLIKRDRIIKDGSSYLTEKKFNISIPHDYDFDNRPIEDLLMRMIDWVVNKRKIPLPDWDFPLSKNRYSRCLILPRVIHNSSEYDFVIVPCIELIRFYFCTSNRIPQALFTGGLHDEENRLYDPNSIVSSEKLQAGVTPFIDLQLKMLDDDALVIGRIAYSKEAMKAAKSIYNVIRKDKLNNCLINPVCRFPFIGKSTLQVVGNEIKATGKHKEFENKKIFLVYSLLKCSGAYPFTELEFDRKNNNQQVPGADPDKKSNWNSGGSGEGKNGNGDDDDNNPDPNIKSGGARDSTAKSITLTEISNRFIGAPKPKKIIKTEQTTSGSKRPPINQEHPDNYTPNPEYGSDADGKLSGGVDIKSTQGPDDDPKTSGDETTPPDQWRPPEDDLKERTIYAPDQYEENFRNLVQEYKEMNLQATFLSDDGTDYLYLDPSPFASSSEEFKWSSEKFDRRKGEWIGGRPVLVVQIRNKHNQEFYLLDWIKRPSESSGGKILFLYANDFKEIPRETINKILINCSLNKRIWLNNDQLKELERKTFQHFREMSSMLDAQKEILAKGKGFRFT